MNLCTYGYPPCGQGPARRYACGWRCPAHTPAKLRGLPEPDSARYCAPGLGRCYCGACPNWTPRTVHEPGATVIDFDAVNSGRRRSGPSTRAGARSVPRRRA